MREGLRRAVTLGLASAMLVMAIATAASAATGIPADNNRKSDNVVGGGSDTTYNVMAALDVLYNASPGCYSQNPTSSLQTFKGECQLPDDANVMLTENYDHDVVREAFWIGSSNGVKQLCNSGVLGFQKINFARSSRAESASDCAGMRPVAYARDAITWTHYTGPGSVSTAVTNLTQAQLNDIYVDCTINNWNQVGGPNQPMVIYTPISGSGTRATFDTFVGGNAENCLSQPGQSPSHEIPENDVTPILEDGQENNAIFATSYGRFIQNGSGALDFDLGNIDGVAPSPTTISDLTFPWGRYIYNYYRSTTVTAKVNGATYEYISEKTGWLCKPASSHGVDPHTGINFRDLIEDVIEADGFVPLPVGAIGGGVTGTSHCRAANLTT